MTYSREMAEAHAMGARFVHTSEDRKIADAITSLKLDLSPHPETSLKESPTWKEDPFGEPNWVFQYHTLRWLDPLRRQAEKGKESDIDVWLHYALSWIDANPPGKGKSRFSWADMVDGARALTFAFALPAIEDLRPEYLDRILSSLEDHGNWLAVPEHIKRGNHALQQHQGLLVVGAVLRRPEWVNLAIERCVDMLNVAYDAQGMNEEGAPQYHHMNHSWWSLMRRRVEITTGSSPEEFDRISLAPVGLAHATRPDGLTEMIGDTEEFEMGGIDHPAVKYVQSKGSAGTPPDELVKVYDRGYVFGRSTWGDDDQKFSDASFYSIRFSDQNRIHGHLDGMALTLYQNGESFFLDSGKFAYDLRDKFRQYFISRQAHNSLSVVGREYSSATSVTLESQSISDDCQSFSFLDKGYEGVVLRRMILISLHLRVAVIADRFQSESPIDVEQWWHLVPGASHRKEDGSVFVRSRKNEARMFNLQPDISVRPYEGKEKPVQGWYSPSWRARVPSRALAIGTSGTDGALTTVIDFSDDSEHSVLELNDREVEGSESVKIVRSDGSAVSVLFNDAGGSVTDVAPSEDELSLFARGKNLVRRLTGLRDSRSDQ